MKINKYSLSKDGTTIGAFVSSSSTTNISSSTTYERNLWGNDDEGGDIDSTLFVNGSLYLKVPDYSDEEDGGEKEDQFIPESDDEGGNIYADGKIKAKEVEADNVYGKSLYLDYPKAGDKKENVADLISSNKTEIDSLKIDVSTIETNIVNLSTITDSNTAAIADNITNIQVNSDEIEKLKNQVSDINGDIEGINLSEITNTLKSMQDELKVLRYGNYQHPVVLLSGKISKYTYTTATNQFNFSGCKSELITSLDITADGGTLYVAPTFADNTSVYINAIHVTQEMSGYTANNDTVTKSSHNSSVSINGRSDGAHWFEAYYEDKKVKIREFHQRNADNDSWGNEYWGGDGGGIRAINITVVGYLFQMN